jgi:hypothetical protein
MSSSWHWWVFVTALVPSMLATGLSSNSTAGAVFGGPLLAALATVIVALVFH